MPSASRRLWGTWNKLVPLLGQDLDPDPDLRLELDLDLVPDPAPSWSASPLLLQQPQPPVILLCLLQPLLQRPLQFQVP